MLSHKDANRLNWDDRAGIHTTDRSGTYPISTVISGGSSLNPIETKEIGDISGKDIVHLQCHIGLDTISLKNLGAKSVTGLDFSARSIAQAREFAREAGAKVLFVEGSVYDAQRLLGGETFDLVYVTWGAINWLGDIGRWARVVAALLRPGGALYLLDTHPQLSQVDQREERVVLARDCGIATRTSGDQNLHRRSTTAAQHDHLSVGSPARHSDHRDCRCRTEPELPARTRDDQLEGISLDDRHAEWPICPAGRTGEISAFVFR
jgi:SAM-dependent methyltransferase